MARTTRRASSTCASGRRLYMRGLVLAPLVCWLGVAAPAAALAQTASQPPSTTPPATTAQEKPPPAAQASAAEAEVPHSLFEPTWRQFQISGRLSSIAGDPGALAALPGSAGWPALHRRAVRARGPGWRVAVPRWSGQRRVARSALLRRLRAHRPLRDFRPMG